MSNPEHDAKTSSAKTGLFAMLGAFLRGPGRGAPSAGPRRRPRRARVFLALLSAAALLTLAALSLTPAFGASEPPSVFSFKITEVNATRAAVLMLPSLGSTWPLEYATKRGGPWTLVLERTPIAEETESLSEIRHLEPDTHYYVRTHASNSSGTTEKVLEFTTTALAPPILFRPHSSIKFSVPPNVNGEEGSMPNCSTEYIFPYSGSFCGKSIPTPTVGPGGLATEVYASGMNTTYRVEYSTSKSAVESGAGTPIPGAAGSLTAAEEFKVVKVPTLEGLQPETTYYLRAVAENTTGESSTLTPFTTRTAHAQAQDIGVSNVTAIAARLDGEVKPNGFETHWRYEYAEAEGGPWTVGPEGVIPQAQAAYTEEGDRIEAHLTGLAASTTYYVRLHVENEPEVGHPAESTSELAHFQTAGRPTATTFPTHALHGEAIRLLGVVSANAGPVDELQTVTVGGGATGGVFTLCLQAQCTGATATAVRTAGSNQATSISLPTVKGTGDVPGSEAHNSQVRREVTGVTTSVGRFLPHHPISGPGIAPGTEIQEINGSTLVLSKETTAAIAGAELTSDGQVFTDGEEVSGQGVAAGTTIANVEYPSDFTETLTLSANATESSSAALTAALPFGAPPSAVQFALSVFPALEGVSSEGESVPAHVRLASDGSYEIEVAGVLAGEDLPQLTADASGLTPSGTGTVTVATVEAGSRPVTHYHFEYEAQGAGGAPFAHPSSTPEEELGEEGATGSGGEVVGADLPALVPGETYRFRLTATNTTAGNPVVHVGEQSLTVPVPPSPAAEAPCPNEAFRTGPSANLPDCRAYEQLTPRDKKGAIEPFRQGLQLNNQGAVVGEDGNHLMLSEQLAHWEFGTEAGQSPYFFSRRPEGSWQTTAAALQPETGLDHDVPELQSPDLTSFAFSAGWQTGEPISPDLEFKVGPPGGPYVTAASVPRAEAKELGWVAASEDFSKLILAVTDRGLIPHHSTETASGADLFEYSGGELRQANVTGASPGTTIGTCGAVIVKGLAEANGGGDPEDEMSSGAHAVSADGSRVFFEAVPGSNCSEPKHLYMRVNGAETRDLGAVRFLAANKEGSELLLERQSGETEEVLLYGTESPTAKVLFTLRGQAGSQGLESLGVSKDFNVIYLKSSEHLTPDAPPAVSNDSYLYRYDIAAGTMRFLMETDAAIAPSQVSPDGRYVYFGGEVAGVPAGGAPAGKTEKLEGQNSQAFLYDSAENLVECVSCASPFDPEPAWPAEAALRDSENGHRDTANGTPRGMMFSANGDYAFFDTIAALVPSDVNGEHEFKLEDGEEKENDGYSNSSDVYEWRRVGVGGCTAVQGCISLISSGREGHLVLLLGTTESGGDVFFTSRSQLGPNDDDNSMDIYDARIGGGEPLLAPRPVECEGDACSTPFAAPSDLTPASATFQGAADLGATLPEAKPKPKPKPGEKAKKKKRAKPKKKGKRAGKKAKKSNDRRGR